jgi:aryl-alcohol dehydrogenase-like predicted oxidoreductase
MRTSQLGSQGPHITALGFGAWAVGGPYKFGWGPTDDAQSEAAIRRAIEAGVNWVDTAAVYGLGHSEEIVGRAVAPLNPGEDVFVFTKCGGFFKPELGKVVYDLRPASIRKECDASLGRLGLERIDLLQFHWPDNSTDTPVEESWSALAELVTAGKVRWVGVSNFDVDRLTRCEAIRHVDSLQPPLNLIKRRARNDVIPWAADHGTGVIVYSPMASGLLTGKYDRERLEQLAPDDWRRNSPTFKDPELGRNLDLVARLRAVADRIGASPATLAIAWTLSVPGVTGAIVGARSPEQVEGWLEAADISLSSDDLAAIESAVAESGAGEG